MTQIPSRSRVGLVESMSRRLSTVLSMVGLALLSLSSSCSNSADKSVQASGPGLTVGVTKVVKKSLGRDITLSSELVPFQEIDVYAKESGYVKKLLVDYGTHVKAGQVMAVLEIPELEAQLEQDQAEIKNAVTRSPVHNTNLPGIRHSTKLCICSTRG